MSYRVLNADGSEVPGESRLTVREAKRSCLILGAHELKNGRKANYRIEPAVDWNPDDVANLDLPNWALEALAKEGLT